MEKNTLMKIILESADFVDSQAMFARNYVLDSNANYVFCGIRRCGKSFLQFQQIMALSKSKKTGHYVYLNFEDERFIEFNSKHFDLILECAQELYSEKPALFFDEIQNIEHWEKFARRLADTGYKVCITGSNAKMLSKEIATTLGGRYLIKEVHPLTFDEFLLFHSVTILKNFEISKQRFEIKKHFESFFQYGGFPEMFKYQNRKEYLSSIFMKVFYGDLVARNHIQNEHVLKLLIKKLAESVNNETSLNRIRNLIQSTGHKIGSNTINEYLGYLFDSYLIFPLNNYVSKYTERETKKKYYFNDQGILNLFITDQDTKLLENIVFLHLYKIHGEQLFYYKRNVEVDFYIPDKNFLIQVCYSLSDIETRKREIAAIKVASKELNVTNAQIITYDEVDSIIDDQLKIEVLPVWQWLLK